MENLKRCFDRFDDNGNFVDINRPEILEVISGSEYLRNNPDKFRYLIDDLYLIRELMKLEIFSYRDAIYCIYGNIREIEDQPIDYLEDIVKEITEFHHLNDDEVGMITKKIFDSRCILRFHFFFEKNNSISYERYLDQFDFYMEWSDLEFLLNHGFDRYVDYIFQELIDNADIVKIKKMIEHGYVADKEYELDGMLYPHFMDAKPAKMSEIIELLLRNNIRIKPLKISDTYQDYVNTYHLLKDYGLFH